MPVSGFRWIAVAGLLSALLYGLGVTQLEDHEPEADELVYLRYAWSLSSHGVFGRAVEADVAPLPDAAIAPGYPFFVATVAGFDPVLVRGMQCVMRQDHDCAQYFEGLRRTQLALLALAAGVLWLWLTAFLGASAQSRAWPAAVFAAVCILWIGVSGAPVYYASRCLTETL